MSDSLKDLKNVYQEILKTQASLEKQEITLKKLINLISVKNEELAILISDLEDIKSSLHHLCSEKKNETFLP